MKIPFDEFERLVEEAVGLLPDEFNAILQKNAIAVVARDRFPRGHGRRNSTSVVFGIFAGTPFGHAVDVQLEPTRIELYRRSFESLGSSDEIREEIRKTVIHEVAHYFGFSENEIRKKGY